MIDIVKSSLPTIFVVGVKIRVVAVVGDSAAMLGQVGEIIRMNNIPNGHYFTALLQPKAREWRLNSDACEIISEEEYNDEKNQKNGY